MEQWTGLLEWSMGATELSTAGGVANFVHLTCINFKRPKESIEISATAKRVLNTADTKL